MDNSIVQSSETLAAVLFSLFLYAYLAFSIQTIAKKNRNFKWMDGMDTATEFGSLVQYNC